MSALIVWLAALVALAPSGASTTREPGSAFVVAPRPDLVSLASPGVPADVAAAVVAAAARLGPRAGDVASVRWVAGTDGYDVRIHVVGRLRDPGASAWLRQVLSAEVLRALAQRRPHVASVDTDVTNDDGARDYGPVASSRDPAGVARGVVDRARAARWQLTTLRVYTYVDAPVEVVGRLPDDALLRASGDPLLVLLGGVDGGSPACATAESPNGLPLIGTCLGAFYAPDGATPIDDPPPAAHGRTRLRIAADSADYPTRPLRRVLIDCDRGIATGTRRPIGEVCRDLVGQRWGLFPPHAEVFVCAGGPFGATVAIDGWFRGIRVHETYGGCGPNWLRWSRVLGVPA